MPGRVFVIAWVGPDAQAPLIVRRPLVIKIYRLEDERPNGWSQPDRAAFAYKEQHDLHIAKADLE